MNVFITGASSGIGEALAREFAARFPGSHLGLLARRESRLTSVAKSLPQVNCQLYPIDVADTSALSGAAMHFLETVGCPDIVIANAGISAGTQTARDGDSSVFRQIQVVNLNAMNDTFAAFLPAMQEQGRGTLVGISSVAGVRGMPGSGAYSSSKAAANNYLESLRVELFRSPLNVVTIAPGFIKTPMTERNNFTMPFLMDADVFAKKAVSAILAKRSFVVIPWQMAWIARVLRVLPNAAFDRMMSRTPRKPSGL